MLNQFCYFQLSGDGKADAVDDEACITTLANVFYRTIYHKEPDRHDKDTVIRHTGRDPRVRRIALPHRATGRRRAAIPARVCITAAWDASRRWR